MGSAERRVALVAGLTALLWIVNPLSDEIVGENALTDTGIAIGAAILLFLLPSGSGKGVRLLDWETAKRAPWAVLILFGGGLSLAHAIAVSGLAEWIGFGLGDLVTWPLLLVIGLMVALVVFLTEITSNTATAATFIPIASALAIAFGISPLDLAAPAAVAASCAFMLPVATPPNAIVYGSGQVSVAQMVRAGFLINIAAILLITLYLPWALDVMFG
jgi:sodium-dependent dicarboxylate transporter 2/3/5